MLLEVCNDLHEIGFRRRSHPGRLRPVVGRDEDHPVLPRRIARGFRFRKLPFGELPAITAVAVQGDQQTDTVGRHLLRKNDDVTLFGLIVTRGESDILRFTTRSQPATAEACKCKNTDQSHETKTPYHNRQNLAGESPLTYQL